MYTRPQVLRLFLRALGLWPTHIDVARHHRDKTISQIVTNLDALSSPHLLVLLWLASCLCLLQE